MSPLTLCLGMSALLFVIGLATVLTRRHAIAVLIGIELMLTAANVNFVAFWRHGAAAAGGDGVVFALFSIAVAAAEAAVGFALILAVHRHRRTADLSAMEDPVEEE